MTLAMVVYVVFGAMFGLATYANRHLFSEGSTRNTGTVKRDPLDGRLTWMTLNSVLWPMFAFTGTYSILRRRRR
ncbi:MAG: hypothetical protein ING52_05280 [Burkholderiales bacterium]|jgi:hypothetical protein|nr:hypothetical protein [Burkholderiales bacterium]MCA3216027.1 hypothetical protein [Burkholderiales bacterium]MCA3224910.1 hypothetical protein [Burkholderiales bacterium]MCE2646379.1 hypothetical protein [Burkholderiaceae bacterium]